MRILNAHGKVNQQATNTRYAQNRDIEMSNPSYADVVAAGRKALAAADLFKFQNELNATMITALADILAEGRAMGKSPAAMVDAVIKDLRSIAEGTPDIASISNTPRVVYGETRTNASIAAASVLAEQIIKGR